MDALKVRPTGQWVLVKVDLPEKISQGGIYLPDGNLMERLGHSSGTVVRTGPGRLNEGKKAERERTPVDLEPGERVVFRGHMQHANRLSPLDREYSLIHETDIRFVLEEGHLDLAMTYDN